MNLEEELEKRTGRIMFMVKATTKKIIKKEFNKLKKDMIKKLKGF